MTIASSSLRQVNPRWWQWPTVLSLDAPAIVLAWQALVATTAHATLGWAERLVLAASVWTAYTIDRWIEAGRLDRGSVSTSRHHFHQQWRRPVVLLVVAVFVVNVTIAVRMLTAGDIALGLLVAGAAATYVISHQWLHREAPFRVPKEICVAGLLTAGLWLFARDGTSHLLWSTLGLFGLLCLTNTALISRWEADVDRRHGQSSLALVSPRLRREIRWLPWVTLAAAVAAASIVPGTAAPAACTALSALLLALVDLAETRTGAPAARVLADVALLTPLVVLAA